MNDDTDLSISVRRPERAGPHPPTAPREDVERLRARDLQALETAVSTYLPQVIRAARGAGLSLEDSEVVAQETFLTFLQAIERFEGRSQVRTFLFGILYRKIHELRRYQARGGGFDPIDEVVESRFSEDGSWSRPPERADHLLRRHELRAALQDCLNSSPTEQRLAFHLREVEGLDTQEICKILGITATNLGVMLYRLRNRARECLERKGVEVRSC